MFSVMSALVSRANGRANQVKQTATIRLTRRPHSSKFERMKRTKSASESVTLSPCQIVAWNLENLRRDKHWSQTEAAKRLKPHLGYAMSRAAWSKMERSLKGDQIRRFD